VVTHANNRAFKALGLIPLEPDDDAAVVIEHSAIGLAGALGVNPSYGEMGSGLTEARQAALCAIMVRAAEILKGDRHTPGTGETHVEKVMRERRGLSIANPNYVPGPAA
jgi:hypothetical protein